MSDLNLYTRHLGDGHGWYQARRVRDELDIYLNYLRRMENHQKAKGQIVLGYEEIRSASDTDCLVALTDPSEDAKHQIYDDNIPTVYEFDPDSDDAFLPKHRIKVVDRDAAEETLLLARRPAKTKLAITSYPYPTIQQRKAVETLAYSPLRQHLGLLKLFHDRDSVEWGGVQEQDVEEWFELDGELDGVMEQREFVRRALATPDFAFLEGPPGSGKTTVLCELIRQLVARKQRVLFCASTHVAVDNLLERLAGGDSKPAGNLIPLRIGDSDNISERNKPYQYDVFLKSIREKVSANLAKKNQSRAQRMMLEVLRESDAVGRIARDCANLVCGTTIGVLGHPDIKSGTLRRFDVMIIDEASKTPFTEFLAPAVHADRWIIAGDTRQLAPYTDDEAIAMSVDSCIPQTLSEACVDAFMAAERPRAGATVVATRDPDAKRAYAEQCAKLGVRMSDADASPDADGRILIGSPSSLLHVRCPGRIRTIRNRDLLLDEMERHSQGRGGGSKAWALACRQNSHEDSSWGAQVGWRVRTLFPYAAQAGRRRVREKLARLMPAEGAEEVDRLLYQTEKVALPSVLELLQCGFAPIRHSDPDDDTDRPDRGGTAITDGMPAGAFGERHVLLEWQHRMHPEIAAFSNRHIYGGAALRTPTSMEVARRWAYDAYKSRLVWIDVRGSVTQGTSYSNTAEAERIVLELVGFCRHARAERRGDSKPWTVAVLSFYKGQVGELRRRMQKLTGQAGRKRFLVPPDDPAVDIELHTVDSFQGHEADMVFLSMVRDRPTIFLNHPNRINVAVTRARYQCVIIGNGTLEGSDPPLGILAKEALSQGSEGHG